MTFGLGNRRSIQLSYGRTRPLVVGVDPLCQPVWQDTGQDAGQEAPGGRAGSCLILRPTDRGGGVFA